MPTDLTPANFQISAGYNVDNFVAEACSVLNGYSNILAISADNELDLMHTEYHGAESYSVSAATDYIHLVSDEIRSHSPGIPVTTKLVGYPDYGGFREQCRDAFWPYVDFISFDTYANSLATYNTVTEWLRTWQNNNTTWSDNQTMWFGETNAGVYPSNAAHFTHDYIDAVTDDGVNVILLWCSYYPDSPTNGFFNLNGSPKASLNALSSELDRIQYPDGAPAAPTIPAAPDFDLSNWAAKLDTVVKVSIGGITVLLPIITVIYTGNWLYPPPFIINLLSAIYRLYFKLTRSNRYRLP
jgi:hypothetical protein